MSAKFPRGGGEQDPFLARSLSTLTTSVVCSAGNLCKLVGPRSGRKLDTTLLSVQPNLALHCLSMSTKGRLTAICY